MAMTVFPKFFVLQVTSGGPYLSVPEGIPANVPSGFLKFQEKQIWSPRAKFEAEPSEAGNGTLVNIRSCYNNKYWVVHKINNDYWVVASADKPQEDQTKPTCTLFQPQLGDHGVHLLCVGVSLYATTSTGDWTDGLLISDTKLGFNVVDWDTLVILPSQVSVKSEATISYLCSSVIETTPLIRFECGLEAGDPLELFPTSDGNYRIKDLKSGKFWTRSSSEWILDNGKENDSELFSFIKISGNVFALRSLGNNTFCGGANGDDEKTNGCLKAGYPTISRETRMVFDQDVLEREFFDLTYRLSDSRIYNEEIQQVSHSFTTNTNPDKETTVALDFSSSDHRTTRWMNMSFWSPALKEILNVTTVPIVENGAVKLSSSEFWRTYEWGEAETIVSTTKMTHSVLLPPLSAARVTLMSRKATCDVPFSYTQRDLLRNGQRFTTIKDDGIFTGTNSYFYFETTFQ